MYNVTTLFYTVMILTHHLQCCHSLMILWLWFCSKHNKEKSVWVLSWWITLIFSPVVYIPGAELDSSSSSFSLWMIKQRLWKQLWWRAWHFSLPECCCLSIEEEKDKSCSYQCCLLRDSHEREAQPCDTTLTITADVYGTQRRSHAILPPPGLHWSDFHQTVMHPLAHAFPHWESTKDDLINDVLYGRKLFC